MPIPDIDKPTVCPEAFFDNGELSEASQAAFLLSLGALLRPEWRDDQEFSSKVRSSGKMVEEFGLFPLPNIRPLRQGMRIEGDSIASFFESQEVISPSYRDLVGNLVERLYSGDYFYEDSSAIAGAILAATLFSGSPIVRVASAVSVMDTFSPDDSGAFLNNVFSAKVRDLLEVRPWAGEFSRNIYYVARSILAIYSRFYSDPEVEEIAQTALSRLTREGDLAADVPQVPRHSKDKPVTTQQEQTRALIIHGTLSPNLFENASLDEWWRPSPPGRLFAHVEKGVPRPDIYGEEDTFEWEGNYNARTREYAANNLRLWLDAHNEYVFDVAPHSHGNNLVFAALQLGAEVRNILAMSCPVHSIWLPPLSQYKKIESVRVHIDLVIMADRGKQMFPKSMGIKEKYVGWFKHGRSHEPDIWKKYNVNSLFKA